MSDIPDLLQNFIDAKVKGTADALTTLEMIKLEGDEVYTDFDKSYDYFDCLSTCLKSKDENELLTITSAILSACDCESGLRNVKLCQPLLQQICLILPSNEKISNCRSWTTKECQLYKTVFQIMIYISKDLTIQWLTPSFRTIMGTVTDSYLLLEKSSEISALALQCLLNLCLANSKGASFMDWKEMKLGNLIYSLTTLCSPDQFDASTSFIAENQAPPEISPVTGAHLLLTLEDSGMKIPPQELLQRLNDSLEILVAAVKHSDDKTALQAADFLAHLLSMPHKRLIVTEYSHYNTAINILMKVLPDSVSISANTHTSILNMLNHVVPLLNPDDKNLYELIFNEAATTIESFSNKLTELNTQNKSLGESDLNGACMSLILCESLLGLNIALDDKIVTKFSTVLVQLLIDQINNDVGVKNQPSWLHITYCKYLSQLVTVLEIIYKFHKAALKSLVLKPEDLQKVFSSKVDAGFMLACFSLSQFLGQTLQEWNSAEIPQQVPQCLAFHMKDGTKENAFKAMGILSKLPPKIQESTAMLIGGQKTSTLDSTGIIAKKPRLAFEISDSQNFDQTLNQLKEHIGTGYQIEAYVKLLEMKIRDQQSELSTQNSFLDAANSLLAKRLDVISKHQQEQSELRSNFMELMNRATILESDLHKREAEIQDHEDFSLQAKNELFHERTVLKAAQTEIVEKDAQISQMQRDFKLSSEATEKIITDFEKKLAIYKTELTSLNHKNQEYQKESETKDALIQQLRKEKTAALEDVAQLTKVQEMVTKLMTKKKNSA